MSEADLRMFIANHYNHQFAESKDKVAIVNLDIIDNSAIHTLANSSVLSGLELNENGCLFWFLI